MSLNERLEKYRVSEADIKQSEKTHTLLLVDDDPDQLGMLVDAFRDQYNLIICRDGYCACEKYQEMKETIDLMVLDIKMEGMDGEQVLEQIKMIRPDAKVIINTGYTEKQISQLQEQYKPTDIYLKGTSIEQLTEKIEKALK
jgi:DNA-binding NtrC family response regulator